VEPESQSETLAWGVGGRTGIVDMAISTREIQNMSSITPWTFPGTLNILSGSCTYLKPLTLPEIYTVNVWKHAEDSKGKGGGMSKKDYATCQRQRRWQS
jgi:hypothetical protein